MGGMIIDLDRLQTRLFNHYTIIINQNDNIIAQNNRIIELLEMIAEVESEIKFTENGDMICPLCKTINQANNTYCQKCGTQLIRTGKKRKE
jgi:rRNA maturation endonuclease Nob1